MFQFTFNYSYLQCITKVGTGVANTRVKAPFSSPVAGSGKPFLPSLTLPANRDFLRPKIDPASTPGLKI